MKTKFKEFCKANLVVFIYTFFMLFTELISVCFIGCSPIFTDPLYFLILFFMLVSMLLIVKSSKTKSIISSILLFLQIAINIGFIYLYDSNGTYFEWSMVNQRSDAFGTIEDLSLRWGLLALLLVCLAIHITCIVVFHKCVYKKKGGMKYRASLPTRLVVAFVLGICGLATILTPVIGAISDSKLSYVDRYLYGSAENKYQQMGITSNAIYEFFNGTLVNAALDYDTEGVEDFILSDEDPYLEKSEYHGISKGNNLVYILVESFEWYTFLELTTKEQSEALYPNLNKFLKDSVYANKFYAREKTDTAEMLALLGSNPTNKYTNYDFPENSYPWALPNMFRESVEESNKTIKQIKSFHQNAGDFYNRNTLHKSLGFEDLVDIKDMASYGIENSWDESKFEGERTLDSITVDKLQNEMFPQTNADEQYMTFWLTFVMHGYYEERETFEKAGYYDRLDEIGAFPEGISKKADYLRTYAAAVMDFDKAVGIMMNKLEENGDLDNTTIVMFADHNTYYNNLSYYAKGIEEKYDSELYRVPFMIYDQKLKYEYENNEGTNVISKFTTTSDMLPTICDLFGIKGYKNLYYGTSMFIKGVESVIFSRAYGIFVTDKLICYSAKELVYKSEDYTEGDLVSFEARAKILLSKQEYLDKIYYNNYFKTVDYYSLAP